MPQPVGGSGSEFGSVRGTAFFGDPRGAFKKRDERVIKTGSGNGGRGARIGAPPDTEVRDQRHVGIALQDGREISQGKISVHGFERFCRERQAPHFVALADDFNDDHVFVADAALHDPARPRRDHFAGAHPEPFAQREDDADAGRGKRRGQTLQIVQDVRPLTFGEGTIGKVAGSAFSPQEMHFG